MGEVRQISNDVFGKHTLNVAKQTTTASKQNHHLDRNSVHFWGSADDSGQNYWTHKTRVLHHCCCFQIQIRPTYTRLPLKCLSKCLSCNTSTCCALGISLCFYCTKLWNIFFYLRYLCVLAIPLAVGLYHLESDWWESNCLSCNTSTYCAFGISLCCYCTKLWKILSC